MTAGSAADPWLWICPCADGTAVRTGELVFGVQQLWTRVFEQFQHTVTAEVGVH